MATTGNQATINNGNATLSVGGKQIYGLTSLACNIATEHEDYFVYGEEWRRSHIGGKSIEITFEGKRYVDDEGQNALIAKMDAAGGDATITYSYKAADGTTIAGTAGVEVNPFAGGDPNTASTISGTLYGIGAPTITQASGA